tara:strand:- start:63 stop:1073 length:1011 start_codon:yes stop_codon:yes gene_type:complete
MPDKKKFNNILLLGGGDLLRKIVLWSNSEEISISVVTSPRHSEEVLDGTKLVDFLDANKIRYLITSNISSQEANNFISNLDNSFCLSLGAAWIFKKEILSNLFNNLLFNLHGTRLPQNRGGATFSWQILRGNKLGFCQLHMIDSGIDTGDLIATEEFLYPSNCRTPLDYQDIYIKENFKFITKFIKTAIKNGLNIKPIPQLEYFSSYWPRLNTKLNGWIDWRYDIFALEKFICAFDNPYEGASTFLNGEVVHLKNVSADFSDGNFHTYQSGLIYRNNKKWISISCSGGTLIVENITDKNGNSIMSNIAFGDRLITPLDKLEHSFDRIIYTPEGLKK